MKKKNQGNQQRKKKIKAQLLLPTNDFLPESSNKLELTISATPENWRELYYLGNADLEHLGKLIFHHVIHPAYEKYAKRLDGSPLSRGLHAINTGDPADGTEADLMRDSRNYIAAAMVVTSYWLEKPRDGWPEFFKKIITKLESSGVDIRHKRNKRFVATKIIFGLWKKKFKIRMRKQGLLGPKDLKSFRRRYINDNSRIEDARSLFQKFGPDITIEDIMHFFPEKSKFTIAPLL